MVKLRLAFDFDGVLANYKGYKGPFHFGFPNPEGVKLANMFHEDGVELICYTCRNNPDMNKQSGVSTITVEDAIRNWLVESGLAFVQLYTGPGKPYAHAYIDDRGAYFPINVGPAEEVYEQVQKLFRDHNDSKHSAEDIEPLSEG